MELDHLSKNIIHTRKKKIFHAPKKLYNNTFSYPLEVLFLKKQLICFHVGYKEVI